MTKSIRWVSRLQKYNGPDYNANADVDTSGSASQRRNV